MVALLPLNPPAVPWARGCDLQLADSGTRLREAEQLVPGLTACKCQREDWSLGGMWGPSSLLLSGSSSGKKSVSHGIPSSSRYQGPQENTAWRSEFKIHGHQGRCRGDFPCLDLQWRELECSHLSLGRGSDEEEGNLLHFLLLPALQCLEDHHPHLIDGRLRLREGRALVESNLELGFQP